MKKVTLTQLNHTTAGALMRDDECVLIVRQNRGRRRKDGTPRGETPLACLIRPTADVDWPAQFIFSSALRHGAQKIIDEMGKESIKITHGLTGETVAYLTPPFRCTRWGGCDCEEENDAHAD